MTIPKKAMLAILLACATAELQATTPASAQKAGGIDEAAIELMTNAYTLGEFATAGKKPTMDTLDEFLDVAEFSSREADGGWRRFDMKYRATTVAFYAALSPDAQALWLRLDLIVIKGDASSRRMLAARLNSSKHGRDGEYRLAENGVLSIVRNLNAATVSAGDIRATARQIITQAEGSASTWRQLRG